MYEHHHYHFDGLIWAIKTDPNSDLITVEIRNKEKKTVEFEVIDVVHNSKHKINPPAEEPWLWGLSGILNEKIVIHGYISDNSPETCYALVYNSDGTIRWSDYRKSIEYISDKGIIVSDRQTEPKKMELLDVLSGKIISDSIESQTSFEDQTKIFPTYDTILNRLYARHEDTTIEGSIVDSNCLIKISAEGRQEISFEIPDLANLQVDVFFIDRGKLIILKNRHELLIVNL